MPPFADVRRLLTHREVGPSLGADPDDYRSSWNGRDAALPAFSNQLHSFFRSIANMTPLIWAVAVLLSPLANGAPVSGGGGGSRGLRIPAPYNPQFKPNPNALSHTITKWQNRIAKLKGHINQMDNIGNLTAHSIDNDLEYLATVGYGTPPQWLPVDLDTGSADVWVYSDLMSPWDLTGGRKYYSPNASTTAVLDPNTTWHITYGDESSASGVVYEDVVTLGGIPIAHAAVEAAKQATGNFAQDLSNSGVFGLAFGLHSQTYPQKPTVWSELAKNLPKNVFTVDMKYHADSEYIFGDVKKDKITDNYASFGLLPLPDPEVPGLQFWSLNYTIPPATTEYASKRKPSHSRACVIDTGSTLVMLTSKQTDAYYSQVQDVMQDGMYGYMFPCNQTLPDFNISFGGDNIYTIPGKYVAYTEVPGLDGVCMGGIQADDTMDFSIIGDIFLKSVYAVFDVGNASVGFANKPLN